MDEDAKWKRRFYLFMGARLVGLLVFGVGIAIAMTDLVREGGWPVVGAIVAVAGLVDAVVAPKLLRKQWKADDEAR